MSRRLGQHFLRPAAVERLLEQIAPQPHDVFLEIGAGAGALSLPLAARAEHVVAVELDAALTERLRARAPSNLRLVTGDALTLDLATLVPPGARLVGNLPYYVSSPLLRRFLDLRGHLRDAHLMLQEEVALRVAAGPGSKVYGLLSVLYSLFTDIEVVLRLPPGAFEPPPKVRSAVICARFLSTPRAPVANPLSFERFLKAAFAQRRRTLENNLRDSYPNLKEYLRLLNIEGSRRAETLSVGEFAALFSALER